METTAEVWIEKHRFEVRRNTTVEGRTSWYALVNGQHITASGQLETASFASAEDALTQLLGFAACAADPHSTDNETWESIRASFGQFTLHFIDALGADVLSLAVADREDATV